MIQELRQVEGALAMSRQYRMAMIVKTAMDYIIKMEEHLNELEGNNGVATEEKPEEVSEATGPETSLD